MKFFQNALWVGVFMQLLFVACKPAVQDDEVIVEISLKDIRERGKLIAITDYNSTNYFIYRGTPMGFHYELLKRLSRHLGVDLEVKVSNDLDDNFKYLNQGFADIIALNLTITKERNKKVAFTSPIMHTHQVLVQKKPDNWQEFTRQEINLKVIRNQLNLADKKIYVQENSSYVERLRNLSDEIGDSIHVIEVPMVVEELIKLVSKGEINYTVCDENVARVNQTYYPNIDVQTAISFPQHIAWAVNKESIELRDAISLWLSEFVSSHDFRLLYNKYYRNQKSAIRIKSEYYAITSGRISPYDDIIKKHAEKIDWDWRLLASLIYQESRFKPDAVSWAGAFGLMQMMPATARRFGISESATPEQNIAAGVQYIRWLDQRIQDTILDDQERVKFILASYNVGLGHILDARRLASKYGKNPNKWDDNVDYFLLNKSKPGFYQDEVVRYGYCRGEEPYFYVIQIKERYNHYKNLILDDGTDADAS